MEDALPRIIALLRQAHEHLASDLHISVGSPPVLRVNGVLRPLGEDAVSSGDSQAMAAALLTAGQLERFEANGEVDFSYELEGCARYRINAYRQRGKVSIAIRTIKASVPSLRELQLPAVIEQLTGKHQGLVLVTGPTGSGKSSTLAAMIDHINRTQRRHIVTLEDPIEFLHDHLSSVVDQREVGSDTKSFSDGLRAALRQDPDVILVGEMRDLETISAAVTAAETGHLVFATLHTTDAPQTVDRIIDAFPAHQQGQIRMQLAAVLLAVVSQRLLPRPGGQGRACATEILVNTPAVANLIRTEKVHQIKSVMQTGRAHGMHTLDTALRELMAQGHVDPAAARPYLSEVAG